MEPLINFEDFMSKKEILNIFKYFQFSFKKEFSLKTIIYGDFYISTYDITFNGNG
jgi:hypothetical protein